MANFLERLYQEAQKKKRQFVDAARDVVDPNTKADQARRMAAGQPAQYADQQRQQASPVTIRRASNPAQPTPIGPTLSVQQPVVPKLNVGQPIQQPQLKVSVAKPQTLSVGNQQVQQTPGIRTGLKAPTPRGNVNDFIGGAGAGIVSSAAKVAGATARATTDLRFATPNFIPGAQRLDRGIKRVADISAKPFQAVQQSTDNIARQRDYQNNLMAQRGRTIGNALGTTATVAPQVISGVRSGIAAVKAAPNIARSVQQTVPRVAENGAQALQTLVNNRARLNQVGGIGRDVRPRVNLQDQAALRDYSDYLAGANPARPSELNQLIPTVRRVGEQQGVNLTTGTQLDRLNAANSILDIIGTPTRRAQAPQTVLQRIRGLITPLDQVGGINNRPRNPHELQTGLRRDPQEGQSSGDWADLLNTIQREQIPPNNQLNPLARVNHTSSSSGSPARALSQPPASPGALEPLTSQRPTMARQEITPLQYRPQQSAISTQSGRANQTYNASIPVLEGQASLPLGDVKRFRASIQFQPSSNKIPVSKINPEGFKEIPNIPSRMTKAEKDNLFQSAPEGTQRRIKVATPNNGSKIPVSKITREGDVVTATNVNPSIQRGEKRFAIDSEGNLVPDTNGAYKLFTDEQGRVKQFRIGNEVFNAKDLGDLSEVNGYGSRLATMRRNIERAFGKDTAAKVNQFLVDHQQHQATKLIERQLALKHGAQEIADDLGISFGIGRRNAKKVSAAIQDFGEGAKTRQQLVKEFGESQANKIINADRWFKKQYNTLLHEMNSTLSKYGYDPVPKRKNYYTHFQQPNLWKSFGLKMQEIRANGNPTLQDVLTDAPRGKISNKLAGESEFLEPNKRFNPFALQRKGDTHTSDAFQSFERYLNPTLNNIYMTPSIARARLLSKAVAQEADAVGKDANKTIIQVKEWANNLAGKSNRIDRPLIDGDWSSKYLKASQFLQRKVGQNTIVGNLATAALQPITLAQSTGKFGLKNILLAAAQEMSTAHSANAAIRRSEFMRRRYADLRPVTSGKIDRARDIANVPLQVVEETSARITWNAAHNDALSKGLKGREAIHYADVQTEKTLAGRSIGEKPELFNSKAASPITMFQLEVNNYWQQLGKEMTKKQAATTLVAAYAFNLALQEATGRNVGFNPIDAAIDSYQEVNNPDNSVKEKITKAGQRFLGEAVDNAPIVAPIANATIGDRSLRKILGPTSNAGRYGVSSPVSAVIDNPWYLVSPFGGAQFKKTYQGMKANLEGGVFNKNGDQTVGVDSNLESKIKGGLFGKSAIPQVADYYNNQSGSGKTPVKKEIGDSKLANTLEDIDRSSKQKKKDFKASLSKEDYELSQLSKEDQQKLIKDGTITQEKLTGLNNYIRNKKKDLGLDYGKPNIKNFDKLDKNIQDFYYTKKANSENDDWKKQVVDKNGSDLIRRANQIRPSDLPELPDTNAVASLYADFVQKRQAEKWSPTREVKEKQKLLQSAYKSQLSEDDKFWLSGSDGQLRQAIDNGDISKDKLDQLVAYDNLQATLGSSAQIGKTLRRLLGYGLPPDAKYGNVKYASSGGSRGRKGKKLNPSAFESPLDILTKYSIKSANIAASAKLGK